MSNYPKIPEGWEQVRNSNDIDFDDVYWSQPDKSWALVTDLWWAQTSGCLVIRRAKRPYDNACGTIYIGTER